MLNEKARAAVELADAAVDMRCRDDTEARDAFDRAVVRYASTAGEPGACRERIASKRFGVNQKSVCGGQTLYLRTGEYEDGRLAEIFIDVNRQGATLRGVFTAFAIAVSLGLQHGVPLEEFVDGFVGMKFEPAGAVIGNDLVGRADSLVDLIFRDLAATYGVDLPVEPS